MTGRSAEYGEGLMAELEKKLTEFKEAFDSGSEEEQSKFVGGLNSMQDGLGDALKESKDEFEC